MRNSVLKRSIAALSIGLTFAFTASASDYPSKPIRIIVPVTPGGALDISVRLVALKMSEKLGQPIVVENRPGGDTVLATRAAKDLPADGYTILAQSNPFSTQPALKKDAGYDPLVDFIPLGPIIRGPVIIEQSADLPDKDLKAFAARARSSKLSFASPGIGTAPHLAGALALRKLGVDVLHVPYKGASAAYADVVSGRVDLFVDGYAGSAQFLSSGKMRALAVTGPARVSVLPDVQTLQEQGIDVVYSYWIGLVLKAGTPPDVVAKLSEALKYATSSRELIERFRADGVDSSFMTPVEFREYIAKEIVEAGKLIVDLKIPKE
ncbi:tripartite tricarboxylate transporter substrate binding protein [Variovorax sp. WS11]|uniref:Bug family tripartite tricarboxylate transporter substrate binding protein n=1 Tax=Variovorax sp. WS11 TaxID=1105204 RepID=UPI0013DB4A08|nr:tripartite tricarboxylate transporter substrate binding protein [Variovorax sp. WS11]NDZ18868.1 tripartite tricarboxylate transporter substrate binding protein [Variovorax sp. WS11]